MKEEVRRAPYYTDKGKDHEAFEGLHVAAHSLIYVTLLFLRRRGHGSKYILYICPLVFTPMTTARLDPI